MDNGSVVMMKFLSSVVAVMVVAAAIGIGGALSTTGPLLVDMLGHVLIVVGFPIATAGSLWLLYRMVMGVQSARISSAERALEMERQAIRNQRALLDMSLVHAVDGVLPVSRTLLESGSLAADAVRLMHAQIDARRTHAPVPNTYSPKITVTQPERQQLSVEEPETLLPAPFTVPTFRELYNAGEFPGDGQILLGYHNDGQRALAQLNKFYSTIISGASNKGKSSLLRYCLLQHLLQSPDGIDLLMCDPHYHAGDDSLAYSLSPLQHMFVGDVASTDSAILDYAKYAEAIGQRRIDGDLDRRPTMLIVDEVSLLLDGSDIERPLGKCLKRIGREFRKVGVLAIIIGQQFGGGVIDTGTRNCFTRVLSCPNIRDNLGRMIPANAVKQVEEISVGQFVDYEVGGGTQVLNFPDTTAADVELVAAPMTSSGASSWLLPDLFPTSSEDNYTSSEKRSEEAPEEAKKKGIRDLRIIQMHNDGASKNKIYNTLFKGEMSTQAAWNLINAVINESENEA